MLSKAFSASLLGLGLLLGSPMLAADSPVACDERLILHTVESIVLLGTPSMQLEARVDTGASYSSLDQNLAKSLGFTKVVGKIKVRNAHGETVRPLVQGAIMLKGQKRLVKFSLVSREQMDYLVLIGRKDLKGFLVDPQPEEDH